ncbi:N-methylhydantoinase B [Novosphingobium sp. SG751A]|uniref:hydantoinase B/oxoprolinase family protein n=1 Tax=Novosphingobium sp. SG751A TaxID=2587000 RepID=UPI001556146E|nr:hydantoinase B/oxoprolinase family protein [Novosphingobium sp. SG751A]NOW44980.1 N-methylhydantoinase B [Novosphingobium sp. SG751A]
MPNLPKIDPVTLEIVRNGLKAVAQRITRRMIRSANSFIVKEMEDCSASVLDAHGHLLAEEAGPPIQLNTVGICLKTIIEHYFPVSAWNPGDIVITNDPYLGDGSLGASHTNDYLAFSPIFFDGELVAFTGLLVHHLDVGAVNMGTRGWNTEIYHEGLCVPPLKIVDKGHLDKKVLSIILNNTRTREIVHNDILSQISSVQVAGHDVLEMFEKFGGETVKSCFRELMEFAERRTREEICAIPDGSWTHEEPILDDGAKGGPFYLRLNLTKSGSELTFDFTGTDPQIAGPINSPLATTLAAVYYCVRAITDSSIANTEGCKVPIKVIAPPGSLVNARAPAAVYQRMVVCHSIVDLVMGALAHAAPERVMGDSCGCMYNFTTATNPETGQRGQFGEVVPGGLGATARADGIDAMACHVTNCHIPPFEAIEMDAPVLYLKREYRTDTEGPGQHRGGVGITLSYKVLGDAPTLANTSQKSVSRPQGVLGGGAADGGSWVINEGTDTEFRLAHTIGDLTILKAGDVVTQHTPGGGGYGDPSTRSRKAVLADVRAGFVTKDRAKAVYGVECSERGESQAA